MGWQASTVKDTAFVESCLRMALWRRDQTDRKVEAGMIHHSDAGSQGEFNWSSQHLDSFHRDRRPRGPRRVHRICRRCL
ncbi:hypothetical protein [Frondihabitans sp. PAMC 28766]|uniref:hypothetical protein n=1 Tax=Frondihabitans sp. PAMC 28766 TaxID=1795630 RepID=UPI003517999E